MVRIGLVFDAALHDSLISICQSRIRVWLREDVSSVCYGLEEDVDRDRGHVCRVKLAVREHHTEGPRRH